MKNDSNLEHMHKLWKNLNSSNSLLDVWNGATEHLIKKYGIDCTLFYKDEVSRGYATELELSRLAQKMKIKEENLLDFLTEEYHRIFFSLADEVLISDNSDK